ncbi:MAG TPA: ABC transporter ATP-binding protein [Acidimicrobiales bacterium]
MAQRALLRCENLRRSFGDRSAVEGISFSIEPGEIYGLLGPNGAGKTTIIKMVCGLLEPDAGEVSVEGRPVHSDLSVRSLIGYVPQDIALYPDLTASENLRFIARLYKLPSDVVRQRVAEVLELCELSDRANDRVDSFSGGMKRRLNIGAGLLHHPRLLVLDEPTVGVDPQSRHSILERVQEFGRSGMAVLYTTHYMEEAEHVCSRVGIIDHGRLIAEGTRRELVEQLGERDRIEMSATGNLEAFAAACRAIPGVDSVATTSDAVQVVAGEGRRMLPLLLEASEQIDVTVNTIDVTEPNLEAVFLHLTGTALRD